MMLDSIGEWAARLREYAVECRTAVPLPDREALSNVQEWHCRILGGALLAWLRQHGPQFLEERAVMCQAMAIDRDPAIVFTSDVPGLVAAREIVGPDHERVIYLLEDEFANRPTPLADPEYIWHVHCWSFFLREVDPDFEVAAQAKHPIPAGCGYWQHSEGTLWARNAGQGGDHLWRWDGQKPELLEEAMSHYRF